MVDTVHCPSTTEEDIQYLPNWFKSQNQACTLKHICGQKMTFVSKWCQFIDYLPYIKSVLLSFKLYKVGHCQSKPEEPIQPIINCLKSQSQALSLNHFSRQNMTFVAEYCQFIAYLPYINKWRMPCLTLQCLALSIHTWWSHSTSSQLFHKSKPATYSPAFYRLL